MKKLFTSTLVISSIVLAPALKADDPVTDDAGSDPQIEEVQTQDSFSIDESSEDEGTPVGQAANEGSSTARKKHWQNIALAIGAVAIAVTALILVANNDGHKD